MEVPSEDPTESIQDSGSQQDTEVRSALHELISRLFSKANFDTDKDLQARLNGMQAVPIETIVEIPQFQEICTDHALIREVLFESKAVIISEDGVRPFFKPEQNTIILRDIPSTASSDEIVGIFVDTPGCPQVTSVRSEMNDNWFVIFASESDARAALEAIKNAKFGDKPVKARLKTEFLSKPYFSNGPQGFQGGRQDFFAGPSLPPFSPSPMGGAGGSPAGGMQPIFFPPPYGMAPPGYIPAGPGMPVMGYSPIVTMGPGGKQMMWPAQMGMQPGMMPMNMQPNMIPMNMVGSPGHRHGNQGGGGGNRGQGQGNGRHKGRMNGNNQGGGHGMGHNYTQHAGGSHSGGGGGGYGQNYSNNRRYGNPAGMGFMPGYDWPMPAPQVHYFPARGPVMGPVLLREGESGDGMAPPMMVAPLDMLDGTLGVPPPELHGNAHEFTGSWANEGKFDAASSSSSGAGLAAAADSAVDQGGVAQGGDGGSGEGGLRGGHATVPAGDDTGGAETSVRFSNQNTPNRRHNNQSQGGAGRQGQQGQQGQHGNNNPRRRNDGGGGGGGTGGSGQSGREAQEAGHGGRRSGDKERDATANAGSGGDNRTDRRSGKEKSVPASPNRRNGPGDEATPGQVAGQGVSTVTGSGNGTGTARGEKGGRDRGKDTKGKAGAPAVPAKAAQAPEFNMKLDFPTLGIQGESDGSSTAGQPTAPAAGAKTGWAALLRGPSSELSDTTVTIASADVIEAGNKKHTSEGAAVAGAEAGLSGSLSIDDGDTSVHCPYIADVILNDEGSASSNLAFTVNSTATPPATTEDPNPSTSAANATTAAVVATAAGTAAAVLTTATPAAVPTRSPKNGGGGGQQGRTGGAPAPGKVIAGSTSGRATTASTNKAWGANKAVVEIKPTEKDPETAPSFNFGFNSENSEEDKPAAPTPTFAATLAAAPVAMGSALNATSADGNIEINFGDFGAAVAAPADVEEKLQFGASSSSTPVASSGNPVSSAPVVVEETGSAGPGHKQAKQPSPKASDIVATTAASASPSSVTTTAAAVVAAASAVASVGGEVKSEVVTAPLVAAAPPVAASAWGGKKSFVDVVRTSK